MARKATYDPDKVKELRMKIILDSLTVFSDKGTDKTKVKNWTQYRKELLMKYAPRVLPVLNAGRNDDENLIPKPLLDGASNNSNKEDTEADGGNEGG